LLRKNRFSLKNPHVCCRTLCIQHSKFSIRLEFSKRFRCARKVHLNLECIRRTIYRDFEVFQGSYLLLLFHSILYYSFYRKSRNEGRQGQCIIFSVSYSWCDLFIFTFSPLYLRRFLFAYLYWHYFPAGNFVFFLIREMRGWENAWEREKERCASDKIIYTCMMKVCDYFKRLISENTKPALSYDSFILSPWIKSDIIVP